MVKHTQKLFWILWVLLVIVSLLLGVGYFRYSSGENSSMNVARIPYLVPVSLPHENDLYRLKSSSRFTVIIYESLDCPACRKLIRRIEKDQQKFQDKFSLIYRSYPIFGNTSLAQDQSRIDLCVLKHQPERYWEFRRQAIELYPSFHITALWLNKIAESFVKTTDLDKCKTSLSIQEEIEKDLLEWKKSYIDRTPTVIVFDNQKQVARYTPSAEQAYKILSYLSSFDGNADFFWSDEIFQSFWH